MTKNEFINQLSLILEENIEETSLLREFGLYDSVGMLYIITMINEKLQIQVDIDRLRNCETVGDLLKLVSNGIEENS